MQVFLWQITFEVICGSCSW